MTCCYRIFGADRAPQVRALTLELLGQAVPVWGADLLLAQIHRISRRVDHATT